MKISADVLKLISETTIDGHIARLPPALSRSTYLAVNKVLEEMGGAWDRKAKGHRFEEDPSLVFDRVLVSGEITTRADLGFFQTPPELANLLVKEATILRGHRVLEPSAGHGALINAVLQQGPQSVVAFELDEKRSQRMRDEYIDDDRVGVILGDFLRIDPVDYVNKFGAFDRVIMNPPFARQQDIDHVLHAFHFLKTPGCLVAVMSAGVSFRMDKKSQAFRKWTLQHDAESFDNEPGSFKASGTDVNTITLVVSKV